MKRINLRFISPWVLFLATILITNSCTKERTMKELDLEKSSLQIKFEKVQISEKLMSSVEKMGNDEIIWDIQWNKLNKKTEIIGGKKYTYIPILPRLKSGKKVGAVNYKRYLLEINENDITRYYIAHAFEDETAMKRAGGKSFSGTLFLKSLEGNDNSQYTYKDGILQKQASQKKSSGSKTASEEDCIYTYMCHYYFWCQDNDFFEITYTIGTSCNQPAMGVSCPSDYTHYYPWYFSHSELYDIVCTPVDPPYEPPTPTDPPVPINPEDPGEAYELTGTLDSIRLQDKFPCFDNVPTDNNTVYSVKLCTDVPNNAYPNDLLKNFEPGHAFLELTKTNGATSVTQTIGFYPEKYKVAAWGVTTNGVVVDNEGHEYDASLLKMLNVQQFNNMLSAAITIAAAHDYNMRTYNCTNYALDVYNSEPTTLSIADTQSAALNYGKTPNELYRNIKAKYNNQYPGASIAAGHGTDSGDCN